MAETKSMHREKNVGEKEKGEVGEILGSMQYTVQPLDYCYVHGFVQGGYV